MRKATNLIPVVLRQNFRGRNAGETSGFPPALASDLVSSGAARWYDDDARQAAERAGFAEKAKDASTLDAEVRSRAEELAAKIVAAQTGAAEEKMAAVISANKKGGAAYAEFRKALTAKEEVIAHKDKVLAAKDEEIAKLRKELEKRGGE